MLEETSAHSFQTNKYRVDHDALTLLADTTRLLSNGSNYEATLDLIAGRLVSDLAKWCVIDLVMDGNKLERVAAAHRDPNKSELVKKIRKHYPASANAKRGVYKVVETGKPILIPFVADSEWAERADDKEHLRIILELGSSSYMCVPLIAQGKVVGTIMFFSDEKTFDEADLRVAEQFACSIAMAVENVSILRKMEATLAELRETQEQLIQSSKLAALGTISAGIAHEVNNPLTVVRCYLEMVKEAVSTSGLSTYGRLGYCLDKMDQNVDRIVEIVNNITEFSRRSEGGFAQVSLQDAVEHAFALLDRQLFLSQIRVHRTFPNFPLLVSGDRVRLQQVFVNVLSNAFDSIRAANGKSGGSISITGECVDGRAIVTISDDGAGLSRDATARAFEPFFTTKGIGEGRGLGLSISHGIIRDHGGSIEIAPYSGHGAKVVIELPLV